MPSLTCTEAKCYKRQTFRRGAEYDLPEDNYGHLPEKVYTRALYFVLRVQQKHVQIKKLMLYRDIYGMFDKTTSHVRRSV